MTGCNDCKHRSGWRTEFYSRGPEKIALASCMHPDWPEWWKARNERPIVMPGAGSACKKYERREPADAPAGDRGTDMSTEALKPCPFCGGEGSPIKEHDHDWPSQCFMLIGCRGCRARSGNVFGSGDPSEWADARAAWNNRPATPASLWADVQRLDAENAQLRGFASEVMGDWPDLGSLDGGDLQDLALKHGLMRLRNPAPTRPCSETSCRCVEYYGVDFNGEFEQPVECYERTALLLGTPT